MRTLSGELVVLLGVAGAGKGTLARHLESAGFLHLSIGNALRREIQAGTSIGRAAERFVSRGELVPDGVLRDLVAAALGTDTDVPVALDGFPRSVSQSTDTKRLASESGRALTAVVYLKAPDSVLLERLAGRVVCQVANHSFHPHLQPPRLAGVCDHDGSPLTIRGDDSSEIARARIRAQRYQIEAVVDSWKNSGHLVEIDATRDPESVARSALEAIGARRESTSSVRGL